MKTSFTDDTRPKVACLVVCEPEVGAIFEQTVPSELDLARVGSYSKKERLALIRDADAIIAGTVGVTREEIEASPNLVAIQKWGVGVDKIDLQAARERGVGVTITAGANAVPVAEHAILLMLATLRHLPWVDSELRQGRWRKTDMRVINHLLHGKVVGLVGCGFIGKEIARRLPAFGVDVIYFDTRRLPAVLEEELGIQFVELDHLLRHADIVNVSVPLTDKTRHMIDSQALSLMKPSAILINTSRGGIVNEDDLSNALAQGEIGGAGIDVFETEPPDSSSQLFGMRDVVVTPHIGGAAIENVANVCKSAYRNLVQIFAGNPLPLEAIVISSGRVFSDSKEEAGV